MGRRSSSCSLVVRGVDTRCQVQLLPRSDEASNGEANAVADARMRINLQQERDSSRQQRATGRREVRDTMSRVRLPPKRIVVRGDGLLSPRSFCRWKPARPISGERVLLCGGADAMRSHCQPSCQPGACLPSGGNACMEAVRKKERMRHSACLSKNTDNTLRCGRYF